MNIDPDTAAMILDRMGEKELAQLLRNRDVSGMIDKAAPYVDEELEPHFEDIKARAESEDYAEAREYYESMSDEDLQDAFNKTVADLIATARECREQPNIGFPKLKQRLRNPDTIEPLARTLGDPSVEEDGGEGVSPDDIRFIMMWGGASVAPEMYSESEREQIQEVLSGE
jgi:hypothetical protein